MSLLLALSHRATLGKSASVIEGLPGIRTYPIRPLCGRANQGLGDALPERCSRMRTDAAHPPRYPSSSPDPVVWPERREGKSGGMNFNRSWHLGSAASMTRIAAINRASSPRDATTCSPTGKLSVVKPQGIEAAGWPVWLNEREK